LVLRRVATDAKVNEVKPDDAAMRRQIDAEVRRQVDEEVGRMRRQFDAEVGRAKANHPAEIYGMQVQVTTQCIHG
jgi:hypothetical protein